MGYALAYLLLIPTFAFVYWLLPYHFYHSTVQYEDVLSADADDILRDIRSSIIEEFKRSHGDFKAEQGDWSLNITSMSVHSLKPEADRTRFTMRLEFWGLNDMKGVQSSVPVNVYIENRMSFGSKSPGEDLVVFKKPEIVNAKQLQVSPSLIFPFKLNKSSWPASAKSDSVWFPVSESLHERILAFSQTVKGFPAKASGAYARMFYFSAVTITTLGYGDIVPITTMSRTLVAFESIIGIVLIGLFLNSLSREHANA